MNFNNREEYYLKKAIFYLNIEINRNFSAFICGEANTIEMGFFVFSSF
jgi:hypothetical protein